VLALESDSGRTLDCGLFSKRELAGDTSGEFRNCRARDIVGGNLKPKPETSEWAT
jgi:hypothetical protein